MEHVFIKVNLEAIVWIDPQMVKDSRSHMVEDEMDVVGERLQSPELFPWMELINMSSEGPTQPEEATCCDCGGKEGLFCINVGDRYQPDYEVFCKACSDDE